MITLVILLEVRAMSKRSSLDIDKDDDLAWLFESPDEFDHENNENVVEDKLQKGEFI